MEPNVLQPSFNEASQLDQMDVWLQQATAHDALSNPSTADLHAVTAIDYNARGQRIDITLGNQTVTTYAYDPETFRLTNLATNRPDTFPANQQGVQNLFYYYDPVGNVTRVRDTADTQDVIYFNNQRVDPTGDYTYDPLYRLIQANWREHLGQNRKRATTGHQRRFLPHRTAAARRRNGDGQLHRAYTYDPVGNLLAMAHQVASGNGLAVTLTRSHRRSRRRRPATGFPPRACPAIRSRVRTPQRTATTRTAT
jgi:YD repeat-containing protein